MAHGNGGWRLSMAVATERCWVRDWAAKDPEHKEYFKTPKIKDMVHETLYLCYLNMISS